MICGGVRTSTRLTGSRWCMVGICTVRKRASRGAGKTRGSYKDAMKTVILLGVDFLLDKMREMIKEILRESRLSC